MTILDQKQQAAFYEFARREDRPSERLEAREWVRSKGMLAKLPNYDPERGLELFATELEAACSLNERSALMPRGPSTLTVRPNFLHSNKVERVSAALECLMNMFAASDAPDKGVRFTFIGNEAYREEDQK